MAVWRDGIDGGERDVSGLLAHCLYALAWLVFGTVHSLLARPWAKRTLGPWLGPWYRLAYNGFAVVHAGVVVGLGLALLDTNADTVPAIALYAMHAVQALGAVGLVVGLAGYDLGRFGGLRQVRSHYAGRAEPEDEPLRLDGLHRYVRHPLYTGAYLLLWGGASSEFGLATALWASLYLWIGTLFEERALLRLYGKAYADYCARVPAVIPWRGRAI